MLFISRTRGKREGSRSKGFFRYRSAYPHPHSFLPLKRFQGIMSNQEKGRLRIRAAALNTMPNDVRSVRLRCIDFLEQRLEFGSTPVDTALDRSHRKTRNLCDLLVGQLLDIT